MKLFIKNMVCNRCVMVVKQELETMGMKPRSVEMGEVDVEEELSTEALDKLGARLDELGFELLDDARKKIIERIKNTVLEMVQRPDKDAHKHNFSDIISEKLNKDYSYLSNLFSEVEGQTIEKYVINQRIEKVKELLVYDELSLSEIAYLQGYSSVAHLSSQFKKVTGLTPSHFKKIGNQLRKPLDKV